MAEIAAVAFNQRLVMIKTRMQIGKVRGIILAGKPPAEPDYRPVLLPMTRGTIAFVHGRTLHGSGPNRAPRPRRALIVHALSGASRLSPRSWVQPPPAGFEPIQRDSSST